jgi:hypothetical protein
MNILRFTIYLFMAERQPLTHTSQNQHYQMNSQLPVLPLFSEQLQWPVWPFCHLICHHQHNVRTSNIKGLCLLYKMQNFINGKVILNLLTAETDTVTHTTHHENIMPIRISGFPHFRFWKAMQISACHSFTNTVTDCRAYRPKNTNNWISSTRETYV